MQWERDVRGYHRMCYKSKARKHLAGIERTIMAYFSVKDGCSDDGRAPKALSGGAWCLGGVWQWRGDGPVVAGSGGSQP